MSLEGLKSVFFGGVPQSVTERQLRKLFSQAGHVVGFRLMAPQPGKEFQSGFVDYVDGRSAEDAIAQLDGHMFGESKMKVSNASSSKKRARTGTQPSGGELQQGAGTDEVSTGPLMEFKRGFRNLFLPGDVQIESALRSTPVAEAYEAVEQLRILVLERPEEARALLENNPQLGIAVVMILQHAGKLPSDHLPDDAVVGNSAVTSADHNSNTSGSLGSAAPANAPPTPDVIAQVMAIVNAMSPSDVEAVMNMTPAELAAIPEESERKQLAFLQQQLKLMDSM